MSMFDSMADGNSALLGGVALGRSLGEGIADMIIDGHERRMAERDAREEQSRWDQLVRMYEEMEADRDKVWAQRIGCDAKGSALERMLKARGIDIEGKDRAEYIRTMREVIRWYKEDFPKLTASMKRLKKEGFDFARIPEEVLDEI